MNKLNNFKRCRSFILLFIILSSFIVGFQVFGKLYSDGGKGSNLTVLDKSLFNTTAENNHFTVDKIVKFVVPYSIKAYDLLDINKISFVSMDIKKSPLNAAAGIYDMAKGLLDDELNQQSSINESTISVSPNGKMLLTSYYSKDDMPNKTYVYDVLMKKNISIFSNVSEAKWLPDSSGFVGIDEHLFVQNIKTGERHNLLRIKDYINNDPKGILNLIILKDGQTVCLTYRNLEGSTSIVTVDIKTGKVYKVNTKGSFYHIFPLNDSNIAVLGAVNDKYGLYSCDLRNNTFKQLINMDSGNEKFGGISISEDSKNIAYDVIRNNGINEIHAASLVNNEKLEDDEVIYRDSKFIEQPMWTKDGSMLYFFQRNADNTIIYRVLLNKQ